MVFMSQYRDGHTYMYLSLLPHVLSPSAFYFLKCLTVYITMYVVETLKISFGIGDILTYEVGQEQNFCKQSWSEGTTLIRVMKVVLLSILPDQPVSIISGLHGSSR